VKPTHIHTPTGKPCRIVSLHSNDMVVQLDMGDYPNPFPRVDACDVRPMNSTELLAQGWDKRSDEVLLARSRELDEAYASETGPAEAFNKDLVAVVHAARALVNYCRRANIIVGEHGNDHTKALDEALDNFEPWLEEENDPAAMGWVGKDGRP
jgi:hypothetical protein